MKARIRMNAWGNWYGYLGSRRVEAFGNSSTETAEEAANRWLRDRKTEARRAEKPICWTTRTEFLTAVGTVPAEVELRGLYGVIYRTRYRLVADRIESLARAAAARVLRTVTDDGVYVVSARQFYNGRGRRL